VQITNKFGLPMPGRRANILSAADLDHLLAYATYTRYPLRKRVIGESWTARRGHRAAGPRRKVAGRTIPIHRALNTALVAWQQVAGPCPHVVGSERGGPMTALSIVVWFNRAFKTIDLTGCSSHSGRRTFVTRAARLVHRAGGSLRDVQLLAGHRSIQTTQAYIDGDTDAQRKLVSLI
jgi:integrase